MHDGKNISADSSKLAEMEFYLVNDLECGFRAPKESESSVTSPEEGEAGELAAVNASGHGANVGIGVGADDGPRYWGTGDGPSTGALKPAWFIVKDTYFSNTYLPGPLHPIVITAIYLTFILHTATRTAIAPLLSSPSSLLLQPSDLRRPIHPAVPLATPPAPGSRQEKPRDLIIFLPELNISLPLIATIYQEGISLYSRTAIKKTRTQKINSPPTPVLPPPHPPQTPPRPATHHPPHQYQT
ncbi:hypothetical protein P691DRAFT_779926 [Macrolepiota fuliginosa MF-IS2]|uniref:Uncharacterized protein n=1 Tax=Macrolepiota fuliginosa MF-IS2 TaxID=1400762 RepID=A0A9P5X0G3_9AGAR|nr:hypothetical protein P691DRAFT_779926 [Macrolepiota fuliginosa MF-IS2]